MVSSADILSAKILVVDDQEAHVELIKGMLRVAGYTSVESTTDPNEVCELYRKNRYSLILLDLQMPGMDGFQVMEGLKGIEATGYLPVLVTTAQRDHKLRALEAGAKDFVSKPFDQAELRARVHNILEVRLLNLETKNYSKALEETVRKLERSNMDLERFAFAASHDLQEPLRMITNYSQLLIEGHRGRLDSEAELCVDFITKGAKQMLDLLANLLTYTEAGADSWEPNEFIDLNAIFEKVKQKLKLAIEESGAVVSSGNLPTVLGHDARFVQLFQNLISNAIKYRGKQSPRIHVSAEYRHAEWRFAVTDNGIGINPEDFLTIFGVFKRLHGSAIPGTGIGLAICRRVVERYGGRIWVESTLGQGTTFYFTLPGSAGNS
jgi:light-regulated signal transduction histidine kinase (bacteriophytochrome)